MKLFRRRREARTHDPHRPHLYQSGGDAGIAPVAGCSRMPDDEIHAPED